MHIAIAAPILVLAEQLPKSLSFHLSPCLFGVALRIRIISITLQQSVLKLVALQASRVFFHLGYLFRVVCDDTCILLKGGTQLLNFVLKLLLYLNALLPILRVVAYGFKCLLELFILFLVGVMLLNKITIKCII